MATHRCLLRFDRAVSRSTNRRHAWYFADEHSKMQGINDFRVANSEKLPPETAKATIRSIGSWPYRIRRDGPARTAAHHRK